MNFLDYLKSDRKKVGVANFAKPKEEKTEPKKTTKKKAAKK